MDFILVLIGLAIFFIFLFKREILVQKKSALYVAAVCIILVLTGVILLHFDIKIGKILIIPFVQYVLYRFLYFIFIKIYKREPKDTWWTMDLSLMTDGIFNFICVLFAFGFPLIWLF